jgi:hypothetical protein
VLRDILGLDAQISELSLEDNGIFVESSWGKQELDALGDGFRALITMLLDLFAWHLLAKNSALILDKYETRVSKGRKRPWRPLGNLKNISGIVIIDEIEKHLHPRLQLRIMKSLREYFPRIQFIVTTHSPIVISGAGDIPTVFLEEGCIGRQQNLEGWLAENIYLRMGTGGSRSLEYRAMLREYEQLLNKSMRGKLIRRDRDRVAVLEGKLKSLPGTDLTLLDLQASALLNAEGAA